MTSPDDPGSGQQPPSYGTPPAYGSGGFGEAPPGFGGPPRALLRPQNSLGTAALVLGIIAIPFGFLVFGGGLGALAVVLGIAGRARVRRGEANNGGVALAGIIAGALGFLIAAAVVVVLILAYNSDTGHKLRNCISAAKGDKVAAQACDKTFGITPTPTKS
jgi:hypothetical protein